MGGWVHQMLMIAYLNCINKQFLQGMRLFAAANSNGLRISKLKVVLLSTQRFLATFGHCQWCFLKKGRYKYGNNLLFDWATIENNIWCQFWRLHSLHYYHNWKSYIIPYSPFCVFGFVVGPNNMSLIGLWIRNCYLLQFTHVFIHVQVVFCSCCKAFCSSSLLQNDEFYIKKSV